MLPKNNVGKLVYAMWEDTFEWRSLEQQLRRMNKQLSQWRRGTKYAGPTFRTTQRTALEIAITMEEIFGVVEMPPEVVDEPKLPAATLPEPPAEPIVEDCGDMIFTPCWVGYREEDATAELPQPGYTVEVRAA